MEPFVSCLVYRFLTRKSTIELVANGRHLYDARLQYDPAFNFTLGCCICRHLLDEHCGGQEEWKRLRVTANGCRCCANTRVVPVKLLS